MGTHPIFESDFDCLTEIMALRPIVMSGPSGVGKSTMLKKLFADFPNKFGFSVSHTSRSPRPGEIDGKDYHFSNKDDMQKAVDNGEFIESATFGGNMYGTSKKAVRDVAEQNQICILDVDEQGVKALKDTEFSPLFIFIKPPSVEELEKRLRGRGTESEESLQKRMATAKSAMDYAATPGVYDYVIVNDDLPRAYDELCSKLIEHYPSLKSDSGPPKDGSGDAKSDEKTVITVESSVPGQGSINLEHGPNGSWWCVML